MSIVIMVKADTSQAQAATAALRAGLEGAERAGGKAQGAVSGLAKELANIKQLAGAAGIAFGAKEIFGMADGFTTMQNRLRGVTSSMGELSSTMDATFAMAQRMRTGWESTNEAFVRMSNATKELGLAQRDVLGLTETIGKAIQMSGASSSEAASGMLQLSQAFASGKLQGDEFRSMSENVPKLLDMIAKEMGVSRGALRELGSEGKITTDVMVRAFTKAKDDIDAGFAKTAPTLAQGWEQFKNELKKTVGEMELGEKLMPLLTNATQLLGSAIKSAAEDIGPLLGGLSKLIETLSSVAKHAEVAGEYIQWVTSPGWQVVKRVPGWLSTSLTDDINAYNSGGLDPAAMVARAQLEAKRAALQQRRDELVGQDTLASWFAPSGPAGIDMLGMGGASIADRGLGAGLDFAGAGTDSGVMSDGKERFGAAGYVAPDVEKWLKDQEAKAKNLLGHVGSAQAAVNELRIPMLAFFQSLATTGADAIRAATGFGDPWGGATAKIEEANPFDMLKRGIESVGATAKDVMRLTTGVGDPWGGAKRPEFKLGANDVKWHSELQKLREMRDVTHGVEQGFNAIGREITDVSKLIETSMLGAFRKMEDALVQFVTTGKLELGSLLSMITDTLARLAIRQATSSIGEGLGLIPKPGGGGGGGGGDDVVIITDEARRSGGRGRRSGIAEALATDEGQEAVTNIMSKRAGAALATRLRLGSRS